MTSLLPYDGDTVAHEEDRDMIRIPVIPFPGFDVAHALHTFLVFVGLRFR